MKNRIGCLLVTALFVFWGCSQEPSDEPAGSSVPTVTTESDEASLETPPEVGAGSAFQVAWTGPDGKSDYITIVEKGAPKGKHGQYTYTRNGSPLELTAGDTPGMYEVRYLSGETKETLVAAPITVNEVKASLDILERLVPVQASRWAGQDRTTSPTTSPSSRRVPPRASTSAIPLRGRAALSSSRPLRTLEPTRSDM